jgi:hypothetical protein
MDVSSSDLHGVPALAYKRLRRQGRV